MKYPIPKNWQQTCDGQECDCCGHGECECACPADWTPRREYELMLEVNALHAEIGRMRAGVRAQSAYCRACHAMRENNRNGKIEV